MRTNSIRNKETRVLSGLVETALVNRELESGSGARELPLGDVVTLDTVSDGKNIETHAVTKYSVVRWSDGRHIKFAILDPDDIFTLQDIIRDQFLS